MWYWMLFHFSLETVASPSHVALHHHKWLTIDLIQGESSALVFFFAASVSFFFKDFPKCQRSNWCTICGHSFFKKARTWTWRSVVNVSIVISWYFCKRSLSPSASILLEFSTVDTWTTWKSITLFNYADNKLQVPYLAEYPGESQRPSPPKWLPLVRL